MKKKSTRITIVMILLVVALVGYYTYLSNRNKVRADDVSMTLVQSTLSRNLTIDYPSTPKELMKYYHDIMKCWYADDTTDEEIVQLALRARELYDEKLLEENPEEQNIADLKSDIAEFRKRKRRITSFAVPASTDVVTYNVDGYEFARIICSYNVVEGGESSYIRTAYLLRRDENKRWKIYGFQPASQLEDAQTQ